MAYSDSGALADVTNARATRLTVDDYARGKRVIIYQARSDPTRALQIGHRVELYSVQGTYLGISRLVEAMRFPEADSVDLILQSTHRLEPTIILNVSIALGWVALPTWASAIHYVFQKALPDTYDQPRVALRPRALHDAGTLAAHDGEFRTPVSAECEKLTTKP